MFYLFIYNCFAYFYLNNHAFDKKKKKKHVMHAFMDGHKSKTQT